MNKFFLILVISGLQAGCTAKLNTSSGDALKKELRDMVEMDQAAAYIPQGRHKDYRPEQWNNFKDSVFSSHKTRTEKLYKKYGFLGFDKVGKEGSNHFWLLVQHLDKYPEFQKQVLKAMHKEVKRENADPNNYAYLYDRVKVNAGEKQMFGTQVTYEVETTGRAIPKIGLIDSANIDHLRKEYNLQPYKAYLNQMTAGHYEMNKEAYLKMGITKPNLY